MSTKTIYSTISGKNTQGIVEIFMVDETGYYEFFVDGIWIGSLESKSVNAISAATKPKALAKCQQLSGVEPEKMSFVLYYWASYGFSLPDYEAADFDKDYAAYTNLISKLGPIKKHDVALLGQGIEAAAATIAKYK
jgi:hypothetical protein